MYINSIDNQRNLVVGNQQFKLADDADDATIRLELQNILEFFEDLTVNETVEEKEVYLAENNISTLPDSFHMLKNLKILDLTKNNLEEISYPISELDSLEELILEDCKNIVFIRG